jgi:hypothetical protein
MSAPARYPIQSLAFLFIAPAQCLHLLGFEHSRQKFISEPVNLILCAGWLSRPLSRSLFRATPHHSLKVPTKYASMDG